MERIDGDVRLVDRKVDAPNGFSQVQAANAGLAFQFGTGQAYPVDLKLGLHSSALDFNDFARFKLNF
jgi:hypothetical protein